MDIKKLKQYGAIKREIKMLERQIARLHNQSGYVADTVVSGSEFPYKKHTVVIQGYEYDEGNINEIRRLKARKKALLHELDDIDTFVNDIDDSTIRQIIQYRYADNLSWTATATRVYGYPKENRARMAVKRFLKKY